MYGKMQVHTRSSVSYMDRQAPWLGKGKKWGETAKIHERTKKCGFAFSPNFGAQSHAKAHSINNLEMFISFQSDFHNKTVNFSLFLFYWQIRYYYKLV